MYQLGGRWFVWPRSTRHLWSKRMAAPSVFFIAAFMPPQRGFKNQVITQTVWQTICRIIFWSERRLRPKTNTISHPCLFKFDPILSWGELWNVTLPSCCRSSSWRVWFWQRAAAHQQRKRLHLAPELRSSPSFSSQNCRSCKNPHGF